MKVKEKLNLDTSEQQHNCRTIVRKLSKIVKLSVIHDSLLLKRPISLELNLSLCLDRNRKLINTRNVAFDGVSAFRREVNPCRHVAVLDYMYVPLR